MKTYSLTDALFDESGQRWVPAGVAQALYDELQFVLSRIDGDFRATARDIVNSNAGGNDLYDDCDFLEEHVRTVLEDVDKDDELNELPEAD